MTKTNFNWKITVKKGLLAFVIGGITALLGFIPSIPVDQNTAIIVGIATSLLTALSNFLKHKND